MSSEERIPPAFEPMEVDKPFHPSNEPISKPTISTKDDVPLPSNGASTSKSSKRAGGESKEDKKPAKKSKKSAPPPIKKRKTAIESDDSDDNEGDKSAPAPAVAEGGTQVLSVAIKVDPSLPADPTTASTRKDADSDLSEEDVPLSQVVAATKAPSPPPAPSASTSTKRKKSTTSKAEAESSASEEDDKPLDKKKKDKKPSSSSSKKVKEESSAVEEEDDKVLPKLPSIKKKPKAATAAVKKEEVKVGKVEKGKGKAKKENVKSESEPDSPSSSSASDDDASSEDDKPIAKKSKKAAASTKPKEKVDKKEAAAKKAKEKAEKERVKKEKLEEKEREKAAKKKVKKEEDPDAEPEEEVYKWWEMENQDTSIKWTTLVHAGVLFPPPYEPLPKHVRMKYNGVPVTLPPGSEEVAGFFAAMIETDHAKDATFQANFFRDFQHQLTLHPPVEKISIDSLEKCDFKPMWTYFEEEKEKKKSLSSAEKKEIKRLRDESEKSYTTCLLDGRKEKVGNFRVEPPGLFRGRGEHPKKGTLKLRLSPEDITINIGGDSPVPVPNIPGKWKDVVHENTVTWLATWKENVNDNIKYVFLAPNSSLKGQSDMAKFEKARALKGLIDRIRQDYTAGLRDKVTADRQRATAMYFIDKLALRAGNEKGEDEADTVGCCSLRIEHVGLIQDPPNTLRFDFLGKDSIRYVNEIVVDEQVFKNVKLFKRDPKVDGDLLFDRLDTGIINKHLGSYMTGLSAKVFRTYNASHTMEQELARLTPADGTVTEKLLAYNRANRAVAVLCNHQRAVGKGHAGSMEKLSDKILALKYQRMKLRHQAFHIEPSLKKKEKWKTMEEDLTDEWIDSHEEENKLKDIEKAKKKFEKGNEKKKADKNEVDGPEVLKDNIKMIKEEHDEIMEETKKKVAKPKKSLGTVAAIEAAMKKLDEKITQAKMNAVDRQEGAEVSLGTSKINYIDPRVTVAWAKKNDVPVEKLLSKVLIEKFQWAVDTNGEWTF
ncbi:hypothetical protein BDY24DRAFT_383028 [Mrakia frigida]|uniref:DNA topoisomerase 1 n=1 Tax=Mrakia frigida TaxID=29902 RepID=UPI003FCBF31F